MADNEVVKTIENVDALFAQIVVNGEVHESSSYVASEATTPSSSQSQQTTVVEEEEELEATDGVGEDVYAVELNDTLHNFVDRAVGEALQNEIQTRGEADLQLHNSVVSLGQRVVQTESSVESLSGQVDTFGTELGNVEDLIPSTATPQNELADKTFVNSSISTNTANFLGTYTSLEQITAIANPTNNDYAFLQTVDQAGNTVYQRYKYNATQSSWLFEYSLNNSSFTAEQWATINSGLTQNLVDTAIANAVNGAISDEVIARNRAIATAINNALDSLDVASVGGSGKYIESISQVDGAIVPVEATIADEVTIGNIHSVSSDAVAQAIASGIESYYTETCSAVQGTSASNITWHCIKTRGGLKICSGRATSVRSGTQYPSGYIYYASGEDEIWKYPSNFFTATPMCIMHIAGATKWMWALNQKSGSKTQTDTVCPACPATFSNETVYYNILAIGI